LARRIRRPVLAYGLLELGVGLAALAVPFAIAGATASSEVPKMNANSLVHAVW
jgi:hypothetical protein